MSKYNFDIIANRKNTNSLKWDDRPNTLPMWVADMDFTTLPEIKEALLKRVNIEAYGYSLIPESFFSSIQNWWTTRHHYTFPREGMVYVSGIVAAISSMVRSLTKVGDKVLVIPPVYNIFYNSIRNNHRVISECHLDYHDGVFSLDMEKLEEKMKEPDCSMLIFCNPHNPTGHIWSKEEIGEVSKLAIKYNVKVISDEIHCDITDPGYEYIPFASVNPDIKPLLITCVSPGKTFNVAGFQSACIIIEDKDLFKVANRGFNNDEVAEPNFFSMDAIVAAYTYGSEYVNEMNEYIYNNKMYFINYLKENLPNLKVNNEHATYLLYIDISYYSNDSIEFTKKLCEETGLYVSEGNEYDYVNGHNFFRINLATSLANVKDACTRLSKFLQNK